MKRQFCSFMLGDTMFGIETSTITEIVARFQVTGVPRAPEFVAGVMNHRGHVITLLLLGSALSLPGYNRRLTEHSTVMFVRNGGDLVGLVVDAIGDVVEVEDADGEPPPESVPATLRQAMSFAYKIPGKLLLGIDLSAVFSLATLSIQARVA